MGRRAYEIGALQDGFVDDPYQVPTFVITHNIPERVAKGAEAFIFVTNGIESALKQAQADVGDRDVVIGGGANTAQQFLMAGLIEKIQIHLVPKLFGQGIRLFEYTGIRPIELEIINVIDAPDVTHLTFRIV